MSIEQNMRTYLLTQSSVTTLVGTRIYRTVREQAAGLPAIVLHSISMPHDYALDGKLSVTDARVQLDCIADTDVAADALAAAVSALLSGFRGTMDSTSVQSCFLEAQSDRNDPPTAGKSRNAARISQDYMISFVG